MKNEGMTALVDGDYLCYRSAFACEEKEYTYTKGPEERHFRYVKDAKELLPDIQEWDRTMRVKLHPVEECLYSIKNTILKVKKATHADTVRVFLGGKNNFREALYKDYKAGRAEKPHWYPDARKYLEGNYHAEVIEGMEADDKMGIEQGVCTIICTSDKDLLQIPGAHYDWVKDSFQYVNPAEADTWFWTQMFCGDRVDNITALDGIGLIRASQLVDIFEGDNRMVHQYCKMCYEEELDMEHFEMNMKLLYIRRNEDDVTTEQILQEVL